MSQANPLARDQSAPPKPGSDALGRLYQGQMLRPALMLGGVLAVLLSSLLFWLAGGRYVETDDSYVDAAKVSLSTDVSGLVGQVFVHDNQHVRAGQPLFSLDQSNFVIAIAGAKAQLAQAAQDITATKRGYAEALAEITAQQVQIAKDQADLARYAKVLGNGGVTREMYDDARFALQADQAKLTQMQQAAGVELAKLQGNVDIRPEDVPEYQNALAALNNAELAQQHSVVKAPFDGTVTQVEQLQPGMFLPAGTAAFGMVSDSDVFVTAQPKENQLTWVRPGQNVTGTVDTYPGQEWRGVVESISPVSGSEFSILPAQNSSGNWVKVVQRLPVRIHIVSGPDDMPLRAGMSTEISIDTRHHRHLSDLF
ncbi:HlyD family secretion protein [Acidocella aromatica]|uniref:Membrane fusion protein (Multidrug efflux system) n=1 Tax=Acidocella aromatica TaxID=1303579 RepID=A0A840VEJ0_9PROT|nr:HlyD family secretion protein [Acidocella aromatica]MBB5373297.1 membrane fusion protein (multidrug efflux system) [Acidocella aromatica]